MRKFLQSYYRSSSTPSPTVVSWPPEFLCPISSRPMSDPVIISSGQSYERNCICAWIEAGQTRCYLTEQPLTAADQSCSFVPNLSLRSAIQRFCQSSRLTGASPPSLEDARLFVESLLPSAPPAPPAPSPPSVDDGRLLVPTFLPSTPPAPSAPPTAPIQPRIYHSATVFDSEHSADFPLPLPSRPGQRDEPATAETRDVLLSQFTQRLRSPSEDEQAAAARELRQLTRSDPASRLQLLSEEGLLSALLVVTASSDSQAQSDSIATIVNLSLEKECKVLLVRAGVLQFLIDALRNGRGEVRSNAVAALFSLAMEEQNRIVIGVIGAIPLLLRLVGSAGAGDYATAEDAAMALYYLSLERGNKGKMIREGAVPILVRRSKESPECEDVGNLRSRCFMILCNLAVSEEGRRSLFGSDAFAVATEAIEWSTGAGAVEEQALALMLLLVGRGNGRFSAAGIQPGVVRAVARLAHQGKGRIKEKATSLLMVIKEAQASERADGGPGGGGGEWEMPPPPRGNLQGRGSMMGPNTTGF